MPALRPQDEVVRICQELIRIDTSNFGDNAGPGERAAAEYAAGLLEEVGLSTEIFESSPGRASVVTRMAGEDPSADALVVHGHLDVVPAQKEDWQVDPFSGEEKDGLIWGRGAVDMKDMDAMILSVARDMARTGTKPKRDIVFAFFADEEAGGKYGARWAVDNRPELFDGATEAISEVGGFSANIGGKRAYLLQTAEERHRMATLGCQRAGWARLADQHGQRGDHVGKRRGQDRRPSVAHRADGHEPTVPGRRNGTHRRRIRSGQSGHSAQGIGHRGTLRRCHFAKHFQSDRAESRLQGKRHTWLGRSPIDARTLPGQDELVLAKIQELAGEDVDISYIHQDSALEVPFAGNLVDAMVDSLRHEDPDAVVLPYTLSGGTDNKSLARLGITGYGFAPLQLPDDLDFTGMFHGVDERVPVDSLKFGTRVLHRLLTSY